MFFICHKNIVLVFFKNEVKKYETILKILIKWYGFLDLIYCDYCKYVFGIKKTIPLILGVGLGYTILVILINFVLANIL